MKRQPKPLRTRKVDLPVEYQLIAGEPYKLYYAKGEVFIPPAWYTIIYGCKGGARNAQKPLHDTDFGLPEPF